jgi:hypothetical protein
MVENRELKIEGKGSKAGLIEFSIIIKSNNFF